MNSVMTPEERLLEVRSVADPVRRLERIMELLRSKDGCPWDRKQTLSSLKPYLIEEAYEAIDAIDANDLDSLCGELGDVLLQVVFQAQLTKEAGAFVLDDVANAICNKLIHRHPHVFGDQSAQTAEQVLQKWERIKTADGRRLLDGIPTHLPALQKAHRIGEKAARVGFDWPQDDLTGPLDKLVEEVRELTSAADRAEQIHELGDVLFAVANIARRMGIDPEDALQAANRRFISRFEHVEDCLQKAGKKPGESSLEEMDSFWNEAKALERKDRDRQAH